MQKVKEKHCVKLKLQSFCTVAVCTLSVICVTYTHLQMMKLRETLETTNKNVIKLGRELSKSSSVSAGRYIRSTWRNNPRSSSYRQRSVRDRESEKVCHLFGIPDPSSTTNPERLFQIPHENTNFIWKDIHDLSPCKMSTFPQTGNIEQICISIPGFYFVYSQIVHYVPNDNIGEIGHQVIKFSGGSGKRKPESLLMKSVTHPSVKNTTSSFGEFRSAYTLYTGGIFYLQANDKISVRPLEKNSPNVIYRVNDKESHFGVFKLKF